MPFCRMCGELAPPIELLAGWLVNSRSAREGPSRTFMLASLVTQLLGNDAEAIVMHAKACNLPLWQEPPLEKVSRELTQGAKIKSPR